jgi:hypothetical protein
MVWTCISLSIETHYIKFVFEEGLTINNTLRLQTFYQMDDNLYIM